MERKFITEEELVRILNEELAKQEDSKGYSFANGVLKLKGVDKNGCNWSTVHLRCSGVPSEPMAPTADRIIREAKKKYNVI